MKKKRKSYNPFKMWGSWIGAIIANLIPISYCFDDCGTLWTFTLWLGSPVGQVIAGFLTFIGFFLGWGIHSLIRRRR